MSVLLTTFSKAWKQFVCGLNDHAGMSLLPNGKWKCKKCGKEMRI